MGIKKIIYWLLSLSFVALVGWPVLASQSAPSFPACSEKIFSQNGDLAHYDSGKHQIVGNGLVEGSDDVYSLGSGNAMQCYCPVEGSALQNAEQNDGIQTDWWNVDDVAQEIIDSFIQQGWIWVDNGQSWNLDNASYLAKNSHFSCFAEQNGEPTPTPTPSDAPSGASPTPTPTPGGQVQGTNVSAPGPASAPTCPDPQPTPPTLLSVTKSSDNSIELVWSSVTDAKYYLISYGLESGKAQFGVPDVGKVTSYRIGGLDLAHAKYYFRVGVVKGCQVSELSNELSFPREIGGQALGLASTGTDFNLLKWWMGMTVGVALAVWGGRNLGWKWS